MVRGVNGRWGVAETVGIIELLRVAAASKSLAKSVF